MPEREHETYIHGTGHEGYWWGCTQGCHNPNTHVFRGDAVAAAKRHVRAVQLAAETDRQQP